MRVGIVGAGLIGTRRAAIVGDSVADQIVVVADVDLVRATALASEHDGASSTDDWQEIVGRDDVDIVVISTVNKWLSPIAVAAIQSGKHVLVEKPAGRSLDEVTDVARISSTSTCVKVGFNLRHHPAISEAHRLVQSGQLGRLMYVRAVYGHGGRAGYDKEWRASKDIAGGGELLDQGVHVADLFNWFGGPVSATYAQTKAAFWDVDPLEDNALGTVEFESGAEGSFHTSWTQWKNRFELQIYGDSGAAEVSGLGGSYGEEELVVYRRTVKGGAPDVERFDFPGEDISWRLEWEEFRQAIDGARVPLGSIEDGVAAMRLIDAMYRSSQSRTRVELD